MSFAVWGSYSASLSLLKPEPKKRNTKYSSSPSKESSCLQGPPNLITDNLSIAIVLFLSTLAAIVHCSRFANYCQHKVHWTGLWCLHPVSRPPPPSLSLSHWTCRVLGHYRTLTQHFTKTLHPSPSTNFKSRWSMKCECFSQFWQLMRQNTTHRHIVGGLTFGNTECCLLPGLSLGLVLTTVGVNPRDYSPVAGNIMYILYLVTS